VEATANQCFAAKDDLWFAAEYVGLVGVGRHLVIIGCKQNL